MTTQREWTEALLKDQRERPRKAYKLTPTLGDQLEAIGKLGMAADFARIFEVKP